MAVNTLTRQSGWNPYNLQTVNQPWGRNIGVGSNTPYAPPQASMAPRTEGKILGATGKLIDKVGKATGNLFPETNFSENLERLGGILNPKPVYASDGANIDSIVSAMVQKGYDPATARAVASAEPDRFAREYLNTGGGGGGNSGGGAGGDDWSPPPPPRNPLLDKDYSNINLGGSLTDTSGQNPMSGIFDEIFEAAKAGNQSAIDAINSQYGQNESELNRQLGMTDTYQGNDLNSLLTQWQGIESDVGKQKTSAQNTVETETGKAADQARMTQRQNRNVLRALGILGSTYAAENLAAPMNQFDKQKATLVNWGNERLAELDNYYNQKKSEYDNLVNDVKTKYGDLREKIMADLRYNNQQKAEALKAATAGAQQNLANLNMQKAQYEQQIEQYRQSLTTQIAQMLMNKAPSANLDDIAKQSIAFSNQLTGTSPNKQVAIARRDPLSGFNMQNYIGWNREAAEQDWLSKNKNSTG